MVKASDLGTEGPRFDPRQQSLVQLSKTSKRWRSSHGNRVAAKLIIEAQEMKAENTIFAGHCVIRQWTCTSLLSRSNGTI